MTQIITPEAALQWSFNEELESILHLLTGQTAGLPDSNVTEGLPARLIDTSGVGSNCAQAYVNDTFALRDYCWCQGSLHPEIVEWDTEDSPYDVMPPSGGTSSGCPANFEHFASGVKGTWYKHLGRNVEFNRTPAPGEALAILMDCLQSLPKVGADSLPAVRQSHRELWGWG